MAESPRATSQRSEGLRPEEGHRVEPTNYTARSATRCSCYGVREVVDREIGKGSSKNIGNGSSPGRGLSSTHTMGDIETGEGEGAVRQSSGGPVLAEIRALPEVVVRGVGVVGHAGAARAIEIHQRTRRVTEFFPGSAAVYCAPDCRRTSGDASLATGARQACCVKGRRCWSAPRSASVGSYKELRC